MERIRNSVSFRGEISEEAGSLKAPLLSRNQTFNSTSEVTVYSVAVQEPPAQFTGTDKIIGGIVAIVLAAGVAASAAAMIEIHQVVVYVAGAFGILNVPLVADAQYKMAKQVGLRFASNGLREQAELLKKERQILTDEINELESLLNSLDGIEDDLKEICKTQGYNCDNMVSLVKENEYTLMQMRKCLREVAMVDVTRIVLTHDSNNDKKICENELSKLVIALRIRLEAQGIDLDIDQFKAMVRKDDDIAHIIRSLGKIMCEDHFDQDRLSAADKSTCEEEESLMSMFVVQDRYTRGAVAKARGSFISLSSSLAPLRQAQNGREMSDMSDDSAILRGLSRRLTLRFDV